ncbi:Striatin [Paragonimus heterotremus]|uniref:Striatin n=1 Tax=Paragonimus heterotremus TaxID=100268 RepID=A0A8J4TMV0_9TREM|nr:Striatin [Paragonimus heterotremus]
MAGRLEGQCAQADFGPQSTEDDERTGDPNVATTEQKEQTPQYTLQGVLHFLQTEWARIEIQRSDWETDRAELRARIAFLEGERRGQENLKQDLVRRIKMLEYALKQERVKFHHYKASIAANAASGTKQAADDSGNPTIKADDSLRTKVLDPGEKLHQYTEQALETNAKWLESRSRLKKFLQEVGCTDALLNVKQARLLQILNSTPEWHSALDKADIHSETGVRRIPREHAWPPSHGRGTDLSDPNLLSALADMDDVVRNGSGASSSGPYEESTEPDTTAQHSTGAEMIDPSEGSRVSRFRRTGGGQFTNGEHNKRKPSSLADEGNPSDPSIATAVSSFIGDLKRSGSPGEVKRFGRGHNLDSNILGFIDVLTTKPGDLNTSSTSAKLGKTTTQSAHNLPSVRASEQEETAKDRTATSGHQLEGLRDTSPNEGFVLGDLADLTVGNESDTATEGDSCDYPSYAHGNLDSTTGHLTTGGTAGDVDSGKGKTDFRHQSWYPRYTLRGHFDGIRSVAFLPLIRAIFTAGEDGCVMLWNLGLNDASSSTDQARDSGRSLGHHPMDEIEPIHVFCGHSGPVLCVTTPPGSMSLSAGNAFSGGLDGSIRGWRIPAYNSSGLYAPHDTGFTNGRVFQGSKAAVWSLAMHPNIPVLVAAHADNVIEFWSAADSAEDSSTPLSTFHLDRLFTPSSGDTEPLGRPTCVQFLANRPNVFSASQCLVGTSTGWLFLLDVRTGQIISQCSPAPKKADEPEFHQTLPTGWTSRALNGLASHHTLSVAIGAHEDCCIRFYDIGRMSAERSMVGNTPFVDGMVAHMDSVTSVAVDMQGLYLLTGSHDASIRVWDLETRACVQEMTNHRVKNNEAVHAVALHPSFPLAASAGADGVCKIYCTSN